jgi:hypothetical protein
MTTLDWLVPSSGFTFKDLWGYIPSKNTLATSTYVDVEKEKEEEKELKAKATHIDDSMREIFSISNNAVKDRLLELKNLSEEDEEVNDLKIDSLLTFKKFFMQINKVPIIALTPNGTILLEFRNKQNIASINFINDKKVIFASISPKKYDTWDIESFIKEHNELLKQFL